MATVGVVKGRDKMAQAPDDIFIATSQNKDAKTRILIVTADGTEDTEFFYPYYRFIEEGYAVDVATPHGAFKGKNGSGLKKTKGLDDVKESDYVLLYIPGGKAPEALKGEPRAVELVKSFVENGKPVAAICHGPQLLAKADVIKDKAIAGYPEIEDEVKEAGATFMNEETLEDGLFTTGRWPGDLPKFTKAVLQRLSGKQQKMAA